MDFISLAGKSLLPPKSPINKSSLESSHVLMTPHHITKYLLVEEKSEFKTVDTRRSMSETLNLNEHNNEFGLCEISHQGIP